MTWHDRPLIGFDLETTGVDPETARIVSAAVVVAGGGLETETRTWLADPGVPIPDEAAAVHGITTERARAEGRPARDVVDEVTQELLVVGVALRPLVIFNARYDLTVLDCEIRRHGIDFPPLTSWERLRVVDPLVLDKWLHRYRKGSRKLAAQAEHYGAVLDDAHNADSDALTACRVAWCIGKRGEPIRRVRGRDDAIELANLRREWAAIRDDLDALHAAQVRWAHDQAVSLADYFRGKGDPAADDVRTEWPVVPVGDPVAT